MKYENTKKTSPSERSLICNQVLRALPSWFGIESAKVKYTTDVAAKDTWAIFLIEKAIGFISINFHNENTAEIHVMGILEEYHNQGYGRKLIETVEDDLINRDFKFFTVKTLSVNHPDQNYAKTRKFYLKMGFTPLEEFKHLWNENNPCLLLVKSLYDVPKVQTPKLSHIEINVSDYSKSIIFYDTILLPLDWKKLTCTQDCTSYSDGLLKIILSPTLDKFKSDGFHRKRVGLNHIALSAKSAAEVNDFYQNTLIKNSIACLYEQKPSGDESYFAVFFEDPDRIKIELVFAPEYCKPHHWTNQFESNYDPTGSSQKLHIDELKKNQLRLIEVGIEHAIEVQDLFENSPTYFIRVSGNKPSSDEAIKAFQNIPKINSHEIKKLSFLVYVY